MRNDSSIFDQSLSIAESHFHAGRWAEAEAIYRYILTQDSQHTKSLYMMGMIAYKTRQYDVAVNLIMMALAHKPDESPLYHKVLGDIFRDQNNLDNAASFYKAAVAQKPDYIEALNNLGTIAFIKDNLDQALSYYQKVFKFDPHHAFSLYNAGLIYERKGTSEEAKKHFLEAIEAKPDFFQAYNSIGGIVRAAGHFDKAQEYYERAIHYNPRYEEAIINLAITHKLMGHYEEALKSYSQALAIRPAAATHASIAALLHAIDRDDLAVNHYEAALKLESDNIQFLNNLGSLYFSKGEFEKSRNLYEFALALDHEHPVTLSNFANTLKNFGQTDKAISYYKKSLEKEPGNKDVYSSLLLSMVYTSSVTPEALAEEAFTFGKIVAAPQLRLKTHNIHKDPDRKLRIGYVSPDFRAHAVNYFFEHLLKLHDRSQFEIYAYSKAVKEDVVTERLKKEFDHWRDIRKKNDDETADIIETDKIDILVDMAGHTGNNSLLVFARKPAPLQVTWLGYPATTGIKAIDYRITDHYAEPEGMTEHLNAETLWRLPGLFCCYGAHENNPAVIDHPPFEDNGYITFGCFNNFAKITDDVLITWRRIMEQVPSSRLLLEIANIDAPQFYADTTNRFRNLGMPLERITFEPRKRENQFVLYNKIDIALDPFPCVGGTTSMDTLWMGVPFITLAGHHFASRMGVTILTNAGLPELIAQNNEEYIHKAVALAINHERLRSIRHNLHDRVINSPMMDQAAFARNMESAYREMWQIYCRSA